VKKEMIKIATVCMLVSVVGFGCTQDTLRNAANREEALKVVCKKYGHDWTGWKFISPSESCLLTVDHLHFGGTEHETYPPWNWKRVCSVCSKLETKKSYSKTNPDVTKAMYDCANEIVKPVKDIVDEIVSAGQDVNKFYGRKNTGWTATNTTTRNVILLPQGYYGTERAK